MSDETTAPVEQSNDPDTQGLLAELDAMRRKNAELLDEYKKAKERAKAVPEGVDVQALLMFKNDVEQSKLESEGNTPKRAKPWNNNSEMRLLKKTNALKSLKTKCVNWS